MLHASYECWLVAITVLMCGWCIFRNRPEREYRLNRLKNKPSHQDHDIEHQALMYLMTQDTDSVVATLARTIEKERQKLGLAVRNPSIKEAVDAFQTESMPISDDGQSPYEGILPMARDGIAVATIARKLQLPEAEVAMVKRLNVA